MGYSNDQQVNHAPAVSLHSADYLTDQKIINEYEHIKVEHLHDASLIERLSRRPTVRRIARGVVRLIMLLIALSIGAALIYYLESDASRALGE